MDISTGKTFVLSENATTIEGKLQMAQLGRSLAKGQIYGINIYQGEALISSRKMTFK